MDSAVARLIERRVPDVPPEPSLWRTPARVAVVASAVVIAVTTNLPWLHQEGIGQTEVLSGNSGYADGTLLTFIAVVTSVVVANRDVARSRTWLLRWLPAILGIVGLLFVLSAVRSMENQIAIWRRFGATGVYEPGFFVFIAAGIVFGVAATWIGLRRGRARTTGGVANERLVISRSTVLSSVISLAGLAIGTLAGGAVALSLDIDPAAVGVPLIGLAVIGGVLGSIVGSRIGRMLRTP